MIVSVEATYESGMLKLSQALPLPDKTAVTLLIKSRLGTRGEEATWQKISKNLPLYGSDSELDDLKEPAWNNVIGKPLLRAWEASDDIHSDDAVSKWDSRPMREFFAAIRKVASANAPVLILGEGGTEKEMTALFIHKRSARRNNSFVPFACGGIPESLLEGELFGFEKRGSTSGHMQRQGCIAKAAGGTLFLDEIGELAPALQMRMLGVLRERVIGQSGGKKEGQIDVRVIAATNADLAHAVREGKFLEELYYQLSVVTINLPPLRERMADIVALAQEFLRKHSLDNQNHSFRFSNDAVFAIQNYDWPGNVRELENRIKRAVIMADKAVVTPADLQLQPPPASVPVRGLREAREALDRELIRQSLQKHGGKVNRAAIELGISRPTLYELMDKLGIKREED